MKRLGVVSATLGALMMAGCLSDSSSVAGIEGTGSPATVSGSVTAYGSVYVNGLHIEIDTADISVDGQPAGVDDITLGMVVDVELDQLQGQDAVAAAVRYNRTLRGPVDALVSSSDVRREIQILGQTVVVYDDVRFDGIAFDALEPGAYLEVSGLVAAEGQWRATKVASADRGPLTAQGRVDSWRADQQRFQLGEQSVDVSQAQVSGDLAEGDTVVVRGGERRGELWYPDRIELIEPARPQEGGQRFQEGVIERFVSREAFEVNGIPVDASEARGLSDQVELGDGVRVMVSGTLRNDSLVAERLQVLRPGINRIRARVDAIDPDRGAVVLLGGQYQLTDLTAFENPAGRGNPREGVNLNSLRVGEWLELYAYYEGESRVVTRVQRQPGYVDTVALSGPVTAIDRDNRWLTVLGVTVAVAGADGEALFDELALGDSVSVTGNASGSHVTARSLSRRDVPEDVRGCPPPLPGQCAAATGPSTATQSTLGQADAELLQFRF
ncbi:DUF5666 domain-containing protein [Marinimicrobium sp. LS-A18]|uniref:DUF5666 domain-containing protein n=1 Tax=Marinimicrobium sp. LS-A18 TaxID=1381596 RepID=UPI000463C803|nr:DUF5666 domain-containing protein [Marinimicrobium sp. LS-A18]